MKFLSEPHVQMSGRLVFTEGWEGVDQVKLLGSGSMGAFSVFGEKFSKASGDFSYENGNFYVTDLDIRHQGGSFSGKVMGVDGEIKVEHPQHAARERHAETWPGPWHRKMWNCRPPWYQRRSRN